MRTAQLPTTDSIRELATFWDTHDLTDFEDQLREVSEPIFERPTVITLHLPPDEAGAVHDIAQAQGIGAEELIRGWVRDQIDAA